MAPPRKGGGEKSDVSSAMSASQAGLGLSSSLHDLTRPISAPNLLPKGSPGKLQQRPGTAKAPKMVIAGLPKDARGFSTTVTSGPATSAAPRPSMPKKSPNGVHISATESFTVNLMKRLDTRDLGALADIASLLEPPSALVHVPQPSGSEQARRKATDAYLARNYDAAAGHFGHFAGHHAEGTPGRALGLRLRAEALLHGRRADEALVDAQAALTTLRQPAADPSTDKAFFEHVIHTGSSADALGAWQVHGVAHEALGHHPEACLSLSRALLLACVGAAESGDGAKAAAGGGGALSRSTSSGALSRSSSGGLLSGGGRNGGGSQYGPSSPGALLAHFITAAAKSPSSLLPLQVYVTIPSSASLAAPATPPPTRPGTAGMTRQQRAALFGTPAAPAFRVVLRPRFTPWPLDLQVGELPGVEIDGGTRLSFFSAYKEMPAEPHACLICHHHLRHALVLLSVRIDGQIEVLSNSTEAAWDQLKSLFSQPPQNRSLHDFEIVASGWATGGMGVATFNGLVCQKWAEWEEGRGRAAAARKEAERQLLKRQAALLEWLTELGLEELHEGLIREGVDLERLQYITEDDLKEMGVTQLAMRRQLMAAVKTQQQYKQLMERIDVLEGENRDLREAYTSQKGRLAQTTSDLASERSSVSSLTAELRESAAERERLGATGGDLATQLAEMTTRYEHADASAQRFAADSHELLDQLKVVQASQQGAFRDMRQKIDRETMAVSAKVKKLVPQSQSAEQVADLAMERAAAAVGRGPIAATAEGGAGGGDETPTPAGAAPAAPAAASVEQPPMS